jgi:hypothetical protein
MRDFVEPTHSVTFCEKSSGFFFIKLQKRNKI